MRIKDKYISPFTDFGFKKLFGTEPNNRHSAPAKFIVIFLVSVHDKKNSPLRS